MRRNSLFDKSSCIKYTIYQKLRNSNGNNFSLIPDVCYFSCLPWIAASEGPSLTTHNTLLQQNEGGGNSHKNINIPLPFSQSSVTPPPLCKNKKKPEVDKKIQACETLTLTKGFVFSSCRCSKQSVSRLLTMNWSEHFIRCGCFQICNGNNNTSLLVHACEVIQFDKQGYDFTVCSGVGLNTFEI